VVIPSFQVGVVKTLAAMHATIAVVLMACLRVHYKSELDVLLLEVMMYHLVGQAWTLATILATLVGVKMESLVALRWLANLHRCAQRK